MDAPLVIHIYKGFLAVGWRGVIAASFSLKSLSIALANLVPLAPSNCCHIYLQITASCPYGLIITLVLLAPQLTAIS